MSKNKSIYLFSGFWAPLPKKLFTLAIGLTKEEHAIFPYACLVFTYLLCQADNYHPSIRIIAKDLCVGRRSVQRALLFLQSKGLIKVLVKGNNLMNKSSVYIFLPIKDWKENSL